VYLVLYVYAVDKKETSVKQTSTEVVLLAVCISVLFVGIPEIDSKFLKWPVKNFVFCTFFNHRS
jgi:hypothetical protein